MYISERGVRIEEMIKRENDREREGGYWRSRRRNFNGLFDTIYTVYFWIFLMCLGMN